MLERLYLEKHQSLSVCTVYFLTLYWFQLNTNQKALQIIAFGFYLSSVPNIISLIINEIINLVLPNFRYPMQPLSEEAVQREMSEPGNNSC